MKKAALLLVVVLLGTMAIAAPKAAAPVAAASSGMRMGIGIDNGMAAMKFAGDTINSSVGLVFQNTSAGGASNTVFGLGGKVTFNLTGGAIPTHAGGGLTYTSLGGGVSTINIAGIYGAETTIGNDLNVGFDIYPLSITSQSGGVSTTTITIGGGTVYAYYMF